MTSSKSRSNSSKAEKTPPGGGTSNAGDASPGGSTEFSGELVSPVVDDRKPSFDQLAFDKTNVINLDDRVSSMFSDLSIDQQNMLMKAFITSAGYSLHPETTSARKMHEDSLLDTYKTINNLLNTLSPDEKRAFTKNFTQPLRNDVNNNDNPNFGSQQPPVASTQDHTNPDNMSYQNVTNQERPGSMFDGRDTPMTTGFSPNVANFSQRSNPDDMHSIPTPTTTTQPAPAGAAYSQDGTMAPSASYSSTHVHLGHASAFAPPATTTTTFGTQSVASGTASTNNVYHHPNSIRRRAPLPSSHATQTNPPSNSIPNQDDDLQHAHGLGGPHLASGLTFCSAPRPQVHSSYDNDRVIVSRSARGNSPKETAKVREICTADITPKITKGKIAQLLTTSGTDYDIAEDAARWQTSLANIWRHIIQYDFTLIALIPISFDPADLNSIHPTTELINCVLDHDKLTDYHYFAWQAFLRQFALEEERRSDAWLHDKLWASLDDELCAEVRSDFDELPNEQKGSISLLRIIINRMVHSNQESRRAMEEFIKSFDLQKFAGENVTKASLRIKAIAQALGPNKLPLDIVHRVLEGFARSSTPTFSSLCHYQESMISSSLVKHNLRQDGLYRTLISVLSDLEVKYNELLTGNRWLGVGTNASPLASTFISTTEDSDTEDSDADDYEHYAVFTASTGRRAIPFDTWVKDKICRNCNEVGHIRRHCPKPLRTLLRGKRAPRRSGYQRHADRFSTQPAEHLREHKSTSISSDTDNTFSSKLRAFITAAHDLSAHDVTAPSPPDDNTSAKPDKQDYSGFLAALGCPKE